MSILTSTDTSDARIMPVVTPKSVIMYSAMWFLIFPSDIYQPSLLSRDVTASLAMIWLDYFCIQAFSSVVHQSFYLLSRTIGEAHGSADHKANKVFVYKKGWKRTHRDRENIWGSEFKFITSFSTVLIWERCTAVVTPRAFCFILQVCFLEAKLGQQSSLNWITFGCFKSFMECKCLRV